MFCADISYFNILIDGNYMWQIEVMRKEQIVVKERRVGSYDI